MEKPHIPYIIPVQPYITPNAAIVNDTKGRHDRHTAAEDQLVAAGPTSAAAPVTAKVSGSCA